MQEMAHEGDGERRKLSNLREATSMLMNTKSAKEAYRVLFYIRRNDKQK